MHRKLSAEIKSDRNMQHRVSALSNTSLGVTMMGFASSIQGLLMLEKMLQQLFHDHAFFFFYQHTLLPTKFLQNFMGFMTTYRHQQSDIKARCRDLGNALETEPRRAKTACLPANKSDWSAKMGRLKTFFLVDFKYHFELHFRTMMFKIPF